MARWLRLPRLFNSIDLLARVQLAYRLLFACVPLASALCLRYAGTVKVLSGKPSARVRLDGRSVPIASVFERAYARRGVRALRRIASIFVLGKTETGRLFGITRQAIDDWYERGVPMKRVADVARVADLASALHARFKPERIPQIVRSPLPGLHDETVLQAIREHGSAPVFALLDRAFSYTP